MCLDTAIEVGGSPVRLLDDEGVYTYLGINIGVHSRLSLEGPLKKGSDDTEKIVASHIAPWQKVDAIKTFILPRFSFFIRNGDPYLKDLATFDKQMARQVKSLLNIPNLGASRHYLHGSPRLGGIGIRSLTDGTILGR
ncbi:hypothetical protein L596_025973 [Steinernema carpocapsae]|uniref:Uncharacterized protein n=1 Tax=Steinernema carpocapsae TaxID=34508 RepID=A0A4U5M9C4_STECR|nr:hypothetical protein L596_025973 [Steinernema carpocapsae]